MPTSKQRPLTAPRGGSEHEFGRSRPDWEATAFDRADYFSVIELRNGRRETRFSVSEFPQAVEFARGLAPDDGGCLYAVAASGRFALLDREKWDEWIIRWRRER
jgi:hypothetical protein